MKRRSNNQHDILNERHRLLSVAIADHLRNDPSHVARALDRVRKQLTAGAGTTRWALEQWQQILESAMQSNDGFMALLYVLTNDDEASTKLRSSSPFTSVLSDAERRSILAHDTDLQRLKRAALRRATWSGAQSTLAQQGTPEEPIVQQRVFDANPEHVMRQTLNELPEFFNVGMRETGLSASSMRAWLRDGLDQLTSGAALAVTTWCYRLLERPLPTRAELSKVPASEPFERALLLGQVELAAAIERSSGAWSAETVIQRLRVSAATLEQWTRDERLLAIPGANNTFVYPAAQFGPSMHDVDVLAPYDAIQRINDVVAGRFSAEELVALLATPQRIVISENDDDRIPLDVIAAGEGDKVVELVRWLVTPTDEGAPRHTDTPPS